MIRLKEEEISALKGSLEAVRQKEAIQRQMVETIEKDSKIEYQNLMNQFLEQKKKMESLRIENQKLKEALAATSGSTQIKEQDSNDELEND
ncbi:hypothetical protein M9Y10_000352 [Tritrichomonas musculus]|uniref:Uncharacterized protein n=1 Tax=Tritrichomonas musculus TaxID=1915356 RepID=A0ABR2L4Z3_9EUKA